MGQVPVFVSPEDSLDADRCSVQGLAPLDLQHCVLMILRMGDIMLVPLPHTSALLGASFWSLEVSYVPDSPTSLAKEGP